MRLLVMIDSSLTALARKGEITERYYNPEDMFDEVHVIITNDDRPNVATVQKLAGRAALYVYSLPLRLNPPWNWVRSTVSLAERIKPDLVRAYGIRANAYLAAHIKRALRIPLVISLHGNPDVDFRGRLARTPRRWLVAYSNVVFEKAALSEADFVIGVYRPIEGFLTRHGVKRWSIIYNAVSGNIPPKSSYLLGSPVRLICVGRQVRMQKNPENILRALAEMPGVTLTLIGDGDLHDHLIALATKLGINSRVRFIKSMANDQLVKQLSAFDLYAYHSDNWEVSKTIIEASLAGLPIVVNRRRPAPVPEFEEGRFVDQVENTSDGYLQSLRRLLGHLHLRQELGGRAYAYAYRRFAPQVMEQRVADVYRSLLYVGGTLGRDSPQDMAGHDGNGYVR